MALEAWNSVCNVVVTVSAGATFLAGTGALITGNIINKRQTERIATLDTKMEELRGANAKLERAADEARTARMGMEKDLAAQRERTAIAERDASLAKVRTEPRKVEPAQRTAIASAIDRFPGTRLEVFRLGDAEAGALARELIATLGAAKWVIDESSAGMMSPPPYGLILSVRGERPSDAMKALLTMLDKTGLPVTVQTGAPHDRLLVGLKPLIR